MVGNPTTTSPLSRYVVQSRSSPAYCGVNPQREATLTTRSARPPSSPTVVGRPSRVVNGTSSMSTGCVRVLMTASTPRAAQVIPPPYG